MDGPTGVATGGVEAVMAKLLGRTPHGPWTCCTCRYCRRKRDENAAWRRSQRHREALAWRAEADAAIHDDAEEYREWLVWWYGLPDPDGVVRQPGYRGGKRPTYWDDV